MSDPLDRDPTGEPPEEATTANEPVAPTPMETSAGSPEAAAVPEETTAAPPEMAPDPVLTRLEFERRLAVAAQPPPWQPGDEELDPNSETGWEKAAAHELPAIRVEDLPPIDPAASPEVSAGPSDGTAQLVPPEVALAPRDRIWRRGARRARRGIQAAARPVVLIALFGVGVALGWSAWLRAQPPPETAAQPAAVETGTTTDIPTPVQSLVAALTSDNQTQLQTVIPADPYRLLAGELSRRDVAKIQGARALSTYSNGADSATEILIGGYDSSGDPVFFNLVVHLHMGVISEFR